MRTLFALSAALLVTAAAAQSSAAQVYGGAGSYGRAPEVRLWADGDRDLFSPGEAVRLRFRTTSDAYVAVVHLATDGTLDFVYPAAPWGEAFAAGQHVYSLPVQGARGRFAVRGTPGIGYFFIVASAESLDFRAFERGGRWDFDYVGRSVRGDPFVALDEIAELLAGGGHAPYSVDYYSYYIGDRYRYPAYACYDRGVSWDYGYGRPCDRVVVLLRQYPDYYDTRLNRRNRGVTYGYYGARPGTRPQPAAPVHGYKERPNVTSPARPVGRPDPLTNAPSENRGVAQQQPPKRPERRRPVLERRPPPERKEPEKGAPPAKPAPARPEPKASPRPEQARPAPAKPAEPRPSTPETTRPTSKRPGG
jgi:hypothetical protein